MNDMGRAPDTDPVVGERLYRQLGVRFDRRTLGEVTALAFGDLRAPLIYVTCNLNHLRVLQSDSGFREAYRKAAVVTLDSRPLQMVSRLRFGERLPLVTGADLFAALFVRLRPGKDRPFFVSGTDETGGELRRGLLDRGFAPEAVFHQTPPFGFQDDADYGDALVARINAHRATHLFFGVGSPKSERWVAERLEALPPAHIFCVGAALEFSAGQKKRAPRWVGRIGFEWLHRLLSEPKRLLPRYAGDAMALVQVLAGRKLIRVTLPRAGPEIRGSAGIRRKRPDMSNRKIAASGFMWNTFQTVGERLFQTIVFFFVARLLEPTAFGLAAMAVAPAAVFAAVMQGASQIIVQDKALTGAFEAAAFWFNIVAGIILGLVIFVAAGPLSDFVLAPSIAPLMRATACVPVLAGLGAVPQGVMNRHFEFRLLALRRTIGITIAGLSCVALAWLGFGAWSLVAQAILTTAVMSIVALFAQPVRIFDRFSVSDLRRVARQSGLLCGSTALIQGNIRLSDLVVGYFTGPAGAGTFRLARTVIDLILSVTFSPLSNVLLPIFAKANDEPERALNMYVKIVLACSLIFSGVEICVIFGAHSFCATVLGTSWPALGTVLILLAPLFPTMCISASHPLLIARHRSGPVLWANAARLMTSVTCVAVGGWILGVNGAAIGYTLCTYLALFGMILFMRHAVPALRSRLGMRVLIPQLLALVVGLGSYNLALLVGLHPENILESVTALAFALLIFGTLCLLLCRAEVRITLDVLPIPGR